MNGVDCSSKPYMVFNLAFAVVVAVAICWKCSYILPLVRSSEISPGLCLLSLYNNKIMCMMIIIDYRATCTYIYISSSIMILDAYHALSAKFVWTSK